MLEDLAVAIENLDVPDRESLVEAIALRDRLVARIACAVGELEVNGWLAVDAAASMTAWLRAHATSPAGTPSSAPTASSKSPTPTAKSAAPLRHAPRSRGDEGRDSILKVSLRR